MSSFARDHIADLIGQDRVLYGRPCAVVLRAAEIWRCSIEHLLGYERSPQMDDVRSALTLVVREQSNLSNSDLALVLARNDDMVISWRVRKANAAMTRRLDPIFSAYWSLVGYLRKTGFPLQGRPSIAEREEESMTLDLRPYLTRREGVLTAAWIKSSVCQSMELDESLLLKRSKLGEYTQARTYCYALMRGELSGFSYPQIARAMRLKGHSSVVTGCQRFTALFAEDSPDAQRFRDGFAVVCEPLGVDPSSYPAKLRDRSFPRSAPDTPTRTTAGSPGRAPEAACPPAGSGSQGENSFAMNPDEGPRTEDVKESPTRSPGGKRRPVSLQKGCA